MTNYLLYVITVLIWGSTWFAMEFQLGEVPVQVSLAYRYALAALMLFLWCILRGKKLRFSLDAHRYFALLGLFWFGLSYMATYFAQYYIASALNAIAYSSLVWLNIINARIFLHTKIDKSTYLGAISGVAGITILFWPQVATTELGVSTLLGASLSVGGALLASFGNIISQKAQQQALPIVQANAWGMLYGALLNVVLAAAQGKTFVFELTPAYVLSLLYLSIFGSVVAFGAYLTLLGRIGAHRAGYAVVMFPVVALLISALYEALDVNLYVVLGVLLVLGGNLIILSDHRRLRKQNGAQGKQNVTASMERIAPISK